MNDRVTQCVVCPKPQQADAGLVCFSCSNRILRYLRELEEYIPTLSLEKRIGGPERRSPGFSSQSPANDAVIMHTDPRSDYSDREGHLAEELSALGVVSSWARVVVEERGVKPSPSSFLDIGLLRRNHDWICRQPWVDEYAGELRQVNTAVRAVAHDPVPQWLGKCIKVDQHSECNGDVYEAIEIGGARCSNCHEEYTGLSLVRFRTAQEAG
jgi:hypothetical protein